MASGLLSKFCSHHWHGIATVLFPIVLLPVIMSNPDKAEFRCMYVILICCFYWITECIPLYVTSLIPLFALPYLNILDADKTCSNYLKDVLILFVGGLIFALAIEYCNFHKRLALKTLLFIGCSPRKLHFGLVLVTAFVSMWIVNSAATAMMCPIVKAILNELDSNKVFEVYMPEEVEPAVEGKKHPSRISMSFYFAIAYASSIGGCGSLIGTGTNLTFKGIYEGRFPESTDKISFASFMLWSVPMVIVDLLLLFICLNITHMGLFRPWSATAKEVQKATDVEDIVRAVVQQKYDEMGPMTIHEMQVTFWFCLMVFLLFGKNPGFMTGWSDIINKTPVGNSTPMLLTIMALFIFPMTCFCCAHCKSTGPYPQVRERALISWNYLQTTVPWGLLFLLGGGFALSQASYESGMAKLLGNSVGFLTSWPTIAVQFAGIFFTTFMTNFSANVPICNIVIPILCEVAVAIKMRPIMLVYPAGIACSMAFHLPVGTPPNALISGYANIHTKYMVEAGVLPSIFTMVVVLINVRTVHYLVYPETGFPEWASAPK